MLEEIDMANSNLTNAKKAKNDEFYTQFPDIQKEIEAYLEYDKNTFRDKVIYCNCDDPFESNFFRYFVLNFKKLGLKQLITTSYKPSPIANTELVLQPSLLPDYEDEVVSKPASKGRPKVTANKFIINEVQDVDSDGEFNLKDIAEQLKANQHNEWAPLQGDGDFQSDESLNLLKQSDIVVTNPPFSLFRTYIKQLVDHSKNFLVIGNMNAITYKEVFPLLKDNKVWLGVNNGPKVYQAPVTYEQKNIYVGTDGKKYAKMGNTGWFTNLDHGRRHQPLPLMTTEDNLKFSKHKEIKGRSAYVRYDNYDAIEVPFTDAIPSDYDGLMGVPISFLDKYNPDQFQIIGYEKSYDFRTKIYPKQLQISKSGKKSNVTKLNDGAAIKVSAPPVDMTYYVIDNEYYIQAYKRIFIKHKK